MGTITGNALRGWPNISQKIPELAGIQKSPHGRNEGRGRPLLASVATGFLWRQEPVPQAMSGHPSSISQLKEPT